jgi:hypothetical protein
MDASQPLQLTITPEPQSDNLSPYQRSRGHAPDIVNNEFLSSFADVLDVINPLQHIPIISSIYQGLTGDKISTGAQIAGDTLFGGILGFLGSIANAIVAQETGNDIAGNVYAFATGKYEDANKLA